MRKILLPSFTILLLRSLTIAQVETIIDTNTTYLARKVFKENLVKNTIEYNLRLPLTSENEKNWMSAFWGMELILYKNKLTESSIRKALKDYKNRSEEFNRAALEAAYTLFPNNFVAEHKKILKQTTFPKHFAMAFNYLSRSEPSNYNYSTLTKFVRNNFPNWKDNPILYMLNERIYHKFNESQKPPLIDLLSHGFVEGSYVLFSLQRSNRDYPGLFLIRKPNGEFLRKDNGTVFYVSQLARSISNLPGYLTNGNTPQGIFSFQAIDTSKNYFIGRTPNLQLVLPFEVDPKKFFHTENFFEWNESLYKNMLPPSWREYTPIYEAFYAGKAGRNEIIAHGTTIDLDFYAGKPYYPHTPTLGCLCTIEVWSKENGQRIYSDQAALINEVEKLNVVNGFFIVVEIDDKNCAVTINDVMTNVLQAEKKFVKLKE